MHQSLFSVLLLAGTALADVSIARRARNTARVPPNSILAALNTDEPSSFAAAVVVTAESLSSMSDTFSVPELEGYGSADVLFSLGGYGGCASGSSITAGLRMTTNKEPDYRAWIERSGHSRFYLDHFINTISPGDVFSFAMNFNGNTSAGFVLSNTMTSQGFSNGWDDLGDICSPTALWAVLRAGHDGLDHVVDFGEIEFPSPAFGTQSGSSGSWSTAEVQTISMYGKHLKQEIVAASGSSSSITFDYVKEGHYLRSEDSADC